MLSAGFIFATQLSFNYSLGKRTYLFGEKAYGYDRPELDTGFIPFGIEFNALWEKKTAKGIFEPGFDLDLGITMSKGLTMAGNNLSEFFCFGEWLSVGPSFGFNIGKKHTIRIVPALQLSLNQCIADRDEWVNGYHLYKDKITDVFHALAVKAAYNFKISENSGINFGMSYAFPFAGRLKETLCLEDYFGEYVAYGETDLSGGYDFRFFVGYTYTYKKQKLRRKKYLL